MSAALISNPDEKYKCGSCDSNFKEPEGTNHLRVFGCIILFLAILTSLVAYRSLDNEVKEFNEYSYLYEIYGGKTDAEFVHIIRPSPGDYRFLSREDLRQMCDRKGPPVPVNVDPYNTTFVISSIMGLWAIIMLVISATRPPRCPNCKSHNYTKI